MFTLISNSENNTFLKIQLYISITRFYPFYDGRDMCIIEKTAFTESSSLQITQSTFFVPDGY